MQLRVSAGLVLLFLFTGAIHAEEVILEGAGATFPYPLYEKWFEIYEKERDLRVTYEAIGSGGGIRSLTGQTVDFGATDAFLSAEDHAKLPGNALHMPTCLGAVAVIYNFPFAPELKLTSEQIANIFTGTIRKWNDPRLVSTNPDVEFPNMNIRVVHRSDSSGTTFIFTDYLTKVSPEWKRIAGRGKKIRWPQGIGVAKNKGVADLVGKLKGAIGYVELTYATQNELPIAAVRNRSGRFVFPDLDAVTRAADMELPDDTCTMITHTLARDGYPISAFTWLIFYQEQAYHQRSESRARELVRLLWWMTHDGQRYNREMLYAPLPEQAVEKAENILKSIRYEGRPLLERPVAK